MERHGKTFKSFKIRLNGFQEMVANHANNKSLIREWGQSDLVLGSVFGT